MRQVDTSDIGDCETSKDSCLGIASGLSKWYGVLFKVLRLTAVQYYCCGD